MQIMRVCVLYFDVQRTLALHVIKREHKHAESFDMPHGYTRIRKLGSTIQRYSRRERKHNKIMIGHYAIAGFSLGFVGLTVMSPRGITNYKEIVCLAKNWSV